MTASPPAPDPLSDFGFLLKDVSRLFSRRAERHVAGLGLTLVQSRVLSYLERYEGICQAQLAELTDADPMTLGRLLVRMDEEGLLERRPHPEDGRARSLALKRKSLPLLEGIAREAQRVRAEALAGLSAAERAQLVSLLERVRANLAD